MFKSVHELPSTFSTHEIELISNFRLLEQDRQEYLLRVAERSLNAQSALRTPEGRALLLKVGVVIKDNG